MKATSTITLHKSKGKIYFRTSVPRDIAIDMLGLKVDGKKQQLTWSIKKGKVVIE